MEKLGFLTRICQDTLANCLSFLKKEEHKGEYDLVNPGNKHQEHDEEAENFNEWGAETSIYKNEAKDKLKYYANNK